MSQLAKHMGIASAKARFSEILREIESGGGPVVVERHGRPVVVIRPYDPDRDERGEHWADALDGVAADIEDFEDVVREVLVTRRRAGTRPVDLDD